MKSANGNFEDVDQAVNVIEQNLSFCGLFALGKPLRSGVVHTVRAFEAAGINIRVVTGDNIVSAKAIALEAGIISASDMSEDPEFKIMEGSQAS